MSEFFTRPPELSEEELNSPKVVTPEAAFARTIATVLMLVWLWWWWTDHTQGAYFIIAAAAIFMIGETMPQYIRPFLFLWWPISFIVRPIAGLIVALTRLVIPEAYRKPQQVLKPLSFKEINDALDAAAAERDGKTKADSGEDTGKDGGTDGAKDSGEAKRD